MIYGNLFLNVGSKNIQITEAGNLEMTNEFLSEHVAALQELCGIESPESINESLAGEENSIVKDHSHKFKQSCYAIRSAIKSGDKKKALAEITKAKSDLKAIEKKVDDVDENIVSLLIHGYFSNIKACFHMLLPTIGVRVGQAKGGAVGAVVGTIEFLSFPISLNAKALITSYMNLVNIIDIVKKEAKKGDKANYLKVFSSAKVNAKNLIKEMEAVLSSLENEVKKL